MSNSLTRVLFGTLFALAVGGLLWLDAAVASALSPGGLIVMPRSGGFLRSIPILRVLSPGLVIVIPLTLLAVLAAAECLSLCRAAGSATPRTCSVIATAILVPVIWLATLYRHDSEHLVFWSMVALLVLLVPAFADQVHRGDLSASLCAIGNSVFCIAYVGLPMAAMLVLRLVYGVGWLAVFLAAAKLTDIGAYMIGSAVGRHPLAPVISPRKTLEGAAGGLLFGVAGSVLAGLLLRSFNALPNEAGVGVFAAFGLCIGVVAQLSDLAESVLKRSASAKDSARSVPGFGGVLDVVDSLLFSAPVAVTFLCVLYWFYPAMVAGHVQAAG